ncbi:MAG: glycosyltransferase family 39 protein [Candidatus Woesebacteria bacterium]|nr:glycosyltransferase family 39 protein [Candidatus Woesebacteria bacterium]
MKLRIADFVRKNKKELLILTLILLVGAFFRLYRISEYMTFLGDEGRDVIIVRRIITELHPPLIGPGTSIGNMYLGPLYYYMMILPLLIANFSPVGPAVQIALLGVATVFFIWFAGREWFGKTAGLVSAGLYAISPTIIRFSRSSWNPNIMPFFALLCIYSIWRVWKHHEFKWLIVLGITFAFVMQSHYLGILLAPTLFVFWFFAFKNLVLIRNFAKNTLIGLVFFAILMFPLLIFDIRHGGTNFSAIGAMVTSRKDVGFSLGDSFSRAASVAVMVSSNLISAKNIYLSVVTLALFATVIIWVCVKKKFNSPFGLILLWLVSGVTGFLVYKNPVFDHYLGFLFPAPFLIIGAIAQKIRKNKIMFSLFTIYIVSLVFVNLKNSPVLSDPNMQMPRAISVAKVIQEKANGERFNLATISDLNNRDVYQYFLVVWGAKVVDTDPSSLEFTRTDQLFVVCERPREKCDPVNNPSAWITSFGWTKILDEWDVWGGTLFKLGHNN